MTDCQRHILRDLAADARRDGLDHHLEAARALARDGVDATTIEGMMRFMYSRQDIEAMIAEAQQPAVSLVQRKKEPKSTTILA